MEQLIARHVALWTNCLEEEWAVEMFPVGVTEDYKWGFADGNFVERVLHVDCKCADWMNERG